jgi:hypothetical protein
MKASDLMFLTANLFLASALSGRVASFHIGLFYGVCFVWFIWRGK